MSLQILMLLLCGDPRNSGGGTAKRVDHHDSMSINLTMLLCAKARNSYRRDRSGTAADRKTWEFHDSRLQAGPVPPLAGPLYL